MPSDHCCVSVTFDNTLLLEYVQIQFQMEGSSRQNNAVAVCPGTALGGSRPDGHSFELSLLDSEAMNVMMVAASSGKRDAEISGFTSHRS